MVRDVSLDIRRHQLTSVSPSPAKLDDEIAEGMALRTLAFQW